MYTPDYIEETGTPPDNVFTLQFFCVRDTESAAFDSLEAVANKYNLMYSPPWEREYLVKPEVIKQQGRLRTRYEASFVARYTRS